MGSHFNNMHKNSETLPISLSPIAPRICSHIVSFEPEFPILSFFLIHKPMPILYREVSEKKDTWNNLELGEEEPRTGFEEQSLISFCK